MDFHSLPRRELQALCKKNRIPANMTNVAMADALQSLQSEAGLAEAARETMQEESPKKVLASSVRRPTARRAAAPAAGASVEPKEQPGSPLPRARRVTAKASEIRRLVSEGEGEEEEEKKEELAEMATPISAVNPRTARRPTAKNTRRGASKKENAETAEEDPLEAAKSPATRNGRRTAARRGAETLAMVEQEGQDAVLSPRMSTRRTRQSSKSTAVVDLTTSTLRRSTRIRARTSVNPEKMEDLVPEPEQVEEGVERKDSSEKLDLETGDVPDLKETEGIEDGITDNNCEKDCDLVVADAVDVVKEDVSAETTEIDDASEEEIAAQKEVEKGVEINIPDERDDDAGEKPSDLQEEIEGGADRNQDNIIHGNDFEQDSVPQHQLDVDAEEGMPDEIGDCEQDPNEVLENVILPQHQLTTDAKEDEMIPETEGFDEQLVAEVEGCSEVDAKAGTTQEIEDCEQDFNGVFENAIVHQHELATDAKADEMIQETECEGFDQQLVAEVEECSEVDAKEGTSQEIEDCEQDSNGVIENATVHQHELATDKEGLTQEIGDCEQDLNGVFENAILPQHQLAADAEEDGMFQETEGFDGFDELLVAEVEGCSEIDAIEGMTQIIEDCEQDSNGVLGNTIVDQHQLAVDAKEGMIQVTEDCEQDSSGVSENAIVVHQLQFVTDAKEEGMIQETEGFDQQPVPEVEGCSVVEQETSQEATAVSSGVEGLHVEGLVSSLEKLEIATDAADWQSEKEEEEVSLDLVLEYAIPRETSYSTCLHQVSEMPKVIESAPVVKSSEIVAEELQTSPSISELQISPSKTSSEIRGVIVSGLEKSKKKSHTSAVTEAIESAMSSPENAAVEEPKASPAKSSSDGGYVITSELKREESDADVESDSSAELAVEGVGSGEMKVENDAESESNKNLDVDYDVMSMRKLRAILKEKKRSNIDKKVEGRRLPLAEINDNQF